MKFFKSLGQKIRSFGRGLGEKIYSGSKYIGQKVYDNRYKIGGAALGLTAAAVGSKMAYDKSAPMRSQMRGAMDTYSQISNVAERQGFKEQFGDMIGSQRAASLLISPYEAINPYY